MILRLGGGITGVVFSLVGAASLLVGAFLAYDLWDARQRWAHATGTVVANDKTCHNGCRYQPVVEFTATDGRTYGVTGAVASATPSFAVGETVAVLYPPEDPRNGRLDTPIEYGLPIGIAGFCFAAFGGLGATFLGLAARRLKGTRWAREFGQRVEAEFVGVERDTALRLSGRCPYRVVAQWLNPRDRKVYRFVSDPMWVDPTHYLQGRAHVPIKLDYADPKHRYWMDLAFLPDPA